ncbi:hypothetical protein [Desulfobulbus propionicus]
MEVFISGLLEESALDQGYAAATGATVTWLDPKDFVKHCETTDNAQSEQRWIWLYRGPWSMLAAPSDIPADQQLLDKWLEQQRVVLKLHHEKPATVLLVNRKTTTAQELFSSLGLTPLPTKTASSPEQNDLSMALAKLFEWIDPYFWEVFEALEAVAWIPKGNPLFRNQLAPPSLETVLQITTLLTAGHRLPEVEKELSEQLQHVHELRSNLKKIQVSDSELNELKQENELLLLQLHQVQEELEKTFLENRERSAALEEEKKKQTQKAVQTKQDYQILEQQLAELVTAEKKSAETLEKVRQANTHLLAEKKALAERNTELEQRAAHELKELQEENELLLLQLHQVQEELESYFLAGQQMGVTLIQSQHTMDQARQLLCRIALQR